MAAGKSKQKQSYIDQKTIKKHFISWGIYVIIGMVVWFYAGHLPFNPFAIIFEDAPEVVSNFLLGALAAVLAYAMLWLRAQDKKKYRKNEEYGSARWGTAEDIVPFVDPLPSNNIILTKTESLTMNSRPPVVKNARNKNVLIIGGAGSGKTRFYLKPNLMQCESEYPTSFVVTDPKGQILVEMGEFLKRKGYKIRVLNTIDFSGSMRYNPFAYIRSEKDILKFVTTLITNTTDKDGKSGDGFWVKAETILYTAFVGYIYYFLKDEPERQNMNTLVEMLNAMKVKEDDEDFLNEIDILMQNIENVYPQHFVVRQYAKYKQAAGKTAKSILISCGARLSPFDIQELVDLTSANEIDFDELGTEKTAFFVIISDTDATFNFVVSLLYTQMFDHLCYLADVKNGGRLPYHVRFLLDEFANIGKIPDFEKLIATIRSREISVNVILQTQSQLKSIYKDDMDTIIGNCDSMLFLGGGEKTTLEEISKMLGKETISITNRSQSYGPQGSESVSHQSLGKDLMSPDELAVMDGGKCILRVRGVRPFISDKFDITAHKNYKYLLDAGSKYSVPFEASKYISAWRKEERKKKALAKKQAAEQAEKEALDKKLDDDKKVKEYEEQTAKRYQELMKLVASGAVVLDVTRVEPVVEAVT